jgi:hypothetical protein
LQQRREAARTRIAAAKAELQQLNRGRTRRGDSNSLGSADRKQARAIAQRRLAEAQAELRGLNVGRGKMPVTSASIPSIGKTDTAREMAFRAPPSTASVPAAAPSHASNASEISADQTAATSQVAPDAVAAATGRVPGPRYTKRDQLTRRLKSWGLDVYPDADDILDLYGALDGKEYGALFLGRSGGTGRLLLRSDATRYEVLHELSHILDFRMDPRGWVHAASNKELTEILQEQAVFNRLRNGRKWWTLNLKEKLHAIEYIDDVGGKSTVDLETGRTESRFRFYPPGQ